MVAVTIPKQIDTIDSFKIMGEDFVILKKDYIDELSILMKSFIEGEHLLKKNQTRIFDDFFKSISKK